MTWNSLLNEILGSLMKTIVSGLLASCNNLDKCYLQHCDLCNMAVTLAICKQVLYIFIKHFLKTCKRECKRNNNIFTK